MLCIYISAIVINEWHCPATLFRWRGNFWERKIFHYLIYKLSLCNSICFKLYTKVKTSFTSMVLSYCVQLGQFRTSVLKSQTVFVCGFLLSTIVQYTFITYELTVSKEYIFYFICILFSRPIIDIICSSTDYTNQVNL